MKNNFIKIIIHYLFLISFFNTSNLIFIYFFQFYYFDIYVSINMTFFLKENISILKNFYDSFLLQIIKKNNYKNIIFNQMYIILYKLLVQIWKDFIIKISMKKKIEYQIIKYTNQKFFMLQSINYFQLIMLILLVSTDNKY